MEQKNNKILIHACCGICSGYPISLLKEMGYEPVVYFCNPNLDTKEEFERRLEAQKIVCMYHWVDLIIEEYRHEDFLRVANGLENEPERGRRCDECIRLRLKKTVEKARELGITKFTTSLVISPHKNFAKITGIAEELAGDLQKSTLRHRRSHPYMLVALGIFPPAFFRQITHFFGTKRIVAIVDPPQPGPFVRVGRHRRPQRIVFIKPVHRNPDFRSVFADCRLQNLPAFFTDRLRFLDPGNINPFQRFDLLAVLFAQPLKNKPGAGHQVVNSVFIHFIIVQPVKGDPVGKQLMHGIFDRILNFAQTGDQELFFPSQKQQAVGKGIALAAGPAAVTKFNPVFFHHQRRKYFRNARRYLLHFLPSVPLLFHNRRQNAPAPASTRRRPPGSWRLPFQPSRGWPSKP